MKKIILSFIAALAISLNVFAQSITSEMIADLKNVTEAVLSPDGNTIAFTLKIPGDDFTGMQKSAMMIIPKAGGDDDLILEMSVNPSSISWSNDSKSVYYLSKDSASKNTQLLCIELATRNVKKITSVTDNIKKYAVSPDGNNVAMLITDTKSDKEKADEKIRKDWEVMDENLKYDRLYYAPLTQAAKPIQLFDNNLHVTDFVWSSDNRRIVFKAAEKTSVDWTMMYESIYRTDITVTYPQKLCTTAGKLGNLSISPDGSMVAFCSAIDINDPLAQSVFVVGMNGGEQKNITPDYESSAIDVKWINDNSVLVLSVEGCFSSLRKIDVSTAKASLIYNKGVIIRGMDLHRKSGSLVFTATSPQNPAEIYTGNLTAGVEKKITNYNTELANIKLSKQEAISWTAADGLKIEGILTYPKDYVAGNKYPLLLQIHGGPEGVSSNGWNTRAVYPVQLYAANGFFVLEPNYRGSQGRGVKFTKADQKDMAGKEFDDVLAGIDFLVGRGMVDKDKVGTGGFSYGGYFSAWAATKHSQRFKAAVMGAGISNWISFSGTSEIIHENSLVHWNLWWYDHMDLVWDRSPLAHINNAKTPMLIVHGSADTRVPVPQSEEMYNALKLKNIPAQYVVYKRQPHGILEREAQLDFMNRTLNWFKKYVK